MDCSCSALIGILIGKQSWKGRMSQFLEDYEHRGEYACVELGELGERGCGGSAVSCSESGGCRKEADWKALETQ